VRFRKRGLTGVYSGDREPWAVDRELWAVTS
jgi:hypothetical protein